MKKSRKQIAKECQKEIADLEDLQSKLYHKALRKLGVLDTIDSFDFMYNDPSGRNSWLEGLK